MRLIALDPGTRTGWATWDGSHLDSGVQKFELGRGESPGMRFIRFRAWLGGLCGLIGPRVLVFEQAHHRGGYATDLLVNLTGRIKELAAERGCETMPVHSGTLKRWATGKGNASKDEMKARALVQFGRAPEDDNEADALFLLAYAREQLEGKS